MTIYLREVYIFGYWSTKIKVRPKTTVMDYTTNVELSQTSVPVAVEL